MSNMIRLRKGSAFVVSYSSPDGNGYHTPDDLERHSLRDLGSSHWVELQPDGFELHYETPSISGLSLPAAGIGCVNNLQGRGYSAPFVGVPIRLGAAGDPSGQPPLCRIDQECRHGFDLPPSGVYTDDASTAPSMAIIGPANVLDHAVKLATDLTAPFNLPAAVTGGNCGITGMFCGLHLGSGNLLLSFSLPAAGPADPPIRFFYNSLDASQSEFGYGWSCLWKQWLEDVDPESAGGIFTLSKVIGPTGATWTIDRAVDGLVDGITDPFSRTTTFGYASSRLTAVTDTAGRTTGFQMDTAGNLTQVSIASVADILFRYDTNRLLTALENAGGATTTFGYDGSRRLTSVTTPNASQSLIAYTTATERVITDPRSGTWTIQTDGALNVTQVVTPAGQTLAYTWDGTTQRMDSFLDGRGNTTSFSYTGMQDQSRRLAGITRPISSFSFTYDSTTGDLTDLVAESGWQSGLTWASHERTTFTNANGGQTTYAYDAEGQLTQAAEPLGNQWNWTYDAIGRLTAAIDPLLSTITYGYDAQSHVSLVADEDGYTTQQERDLLGRMTRSIDPYSFTSTTAYDASGHQTHCVDPLGHTRTHAYDAGGRLTRSVDPLPSTITFGYDASSNRTLSVNQRGLSTILAYDAVNRVTSIVDPLNTTQQFGYDAADNVTQKVDEGGYSWVSEYDAQDRCTQSTDPLSNQQTCGFDAAGQPTTSVDQAGGETQRFYDKDGITTSTMDEGGYVTQNGYDENSRKTKVVDPGGITRTFAYDAGGRVTSSVGPGGTTVTQYDQRGNTTTTIDPNGSTVTFQYNAWGLRTKAVNGNGNTRLWSYDARRRLTQSTDPLGAQTRLYYDAADRRTSSLDADGNTRSWSYDGSGNLTSQSDARPASAIFDYDAGNRRTRETWSDGLTILMGYDALANRTLLVDALGTCTTDYDPRSLPTTRTDTRKPGLSSTIAYDHRGLRTTMTAYDDGTFYFTYDERRLQTQVVDPNSNTSTFTYDGLRRVTDQTLGTGVRTTRQFSGFDVTRLEHFDSGSTLTNAMDCVYDNTGHRLTKTESDGTTTVWDYDAAYQLTGERRTKGATPVFNVSYDYDAAGRRTRMDDGGQVTTYSYSTAGRLTQSVGPFVTTTYAYDTAGNRVTKVAGSDVTAHLYNARNNLIETQLPGGSMYYNYKCDGKLSDRAGLLGITNFFIYDFDLVLARTDDASTTEVLYTHHSGLDGNEIVAQWIAGSGLCDLMHDVNGSTQLVTAPSSPPSDPHRYRTFGLNPAGTQAGGTTDGGSPVSALTNLGFLGSSGVYLDDETQMYIVDIGSMNKGRWFDPFTAQFLSPPQDCCGCCTPSYGLQDFDVRAPESDLREDFVPMGFFRNGQLIISKHCVGAEIAIWPEAAPPPWTVAGWVRNPHIGQHAVDFFAINWGGTVRYYKVNDSKTVRIICENGRVRFAFGGDQPEDITANRWTKHGLPAVALPYSVVP